MITNQTIILPFFLSLDFLCDFEKQTALLLSKKNKVILFQKYKGTAFFKLLTNRKMLNKFKKRVKSLQGNLIHFPILYPIPFHRFSFVRNLNYKIAVKQILWFTKTTGKRPILWLFYPQLESLIGKFNEKLVIYDCVDFHSSIDPVENKFRRGKEKKIFKKADVVFVNSPVLYRLKKRLHPKIFQVPQGCNVDLFLKTKKQSLPKDLKKIPPPRIGFIGNIDYRLDFRLIKNLAIENPSWSFIFLGPRWGNPTHNKIVNLNKNLKTLEKIKNIYFLGKKSKQQLINYIDNFDIELIPYNIKYKFCRFCYPMKVFEYFCRGKPTISTPIESLTTLQPYIIIANNAKEFSQEIKKILKKGWPTAYIKKQKQLAVANSWQVKIEKISQILRKEFPAKFND